jgi:hypothetical protein
MPGLPSNEPGKIVAVPPTAAADAGDRTLPDPTRYARLFLAAMLAVAVVVAVIWNDVASTHRPFAPSRTRTADFALFAGFYVGAQLIERVLELVSPLLPFWRVPGPDGSAVKAAHVRADRAKATLGVATVLGVILSCGLGLYFLAAVGIHAARTIDVLATGVTIAAGTKPLHDFITLLQNQSSPGTGTSA